MIKWDNMKISYQVLAHSRYIINTNFLRPALAPLCPLFITKANSHFNTSFTVMRTPLWQLLLQVSFKPSNRENKRMRQILWNRWAAEFKCFAEREVAQGPQFFLSFEKAWGHRVCFRLKQGQKLVVPRHGRESNSAWWQCSREVEWPQREHREGVWAINPGLPSLCRDSAASKLSPEAAESHQPQRDGMWAWLSYISTVTRGLRTKVSPWGSMMVELSQRSPLTA